MNFISRLFGRKAAQLTYDQIADFIDGAGGRSFAGVVVNEKTALEVATVLACVREIANGCATPDLHVFREKTDGTSEKATNIPEYRLLSRRPNEWQTSFEWRRMMTIHAALTGAGLSIKVLGDNRRVKELIPVQPGQWDVRRIARYEVRYRVWDEFGMVGEFSPDQVFVLNNLQWDWIKPLNAVHLARGAIGLSIATEKTQAKFHENGMQPSGIYSVDGTLSPEQHKQLTAWIKSKSGVESAGTPMILDRATKWVSQRMNGVDAQHVETRRLQIEEVCRAYGVFPIIIGHSDKSATFASSEAFFAAHLKQTLAPWHKAWRDRLDETLLDGAGPLYVKFDTRYLTEGPMKDRAVWARTMAEMGIYTRNEIRDEEGKDPLPDLDKPLTPLNMTQEAAAAAAAKPKTDPEAAKAFDMLERKLDALVARPAAAQPINVEVNVPEQRHTTTVNVPEQKPHVVNVKNDVHVQPAEVNVEAVMPEQKAAELPAPVVHVNVQPADVVVNNNHPKKATQTVERDGDGEILQTVTHFD